MYSCEKLFNICMLILVPCLTKCSIVQGSRVLLDDATDISGVWSEISCNYNLHHQDFWVYGCPLTSVKETGSTGFWTTCMPSSCEITFRNLNNNLQGSLKVTVAAYIEDDAGILISGGKMNDENIVEFTEIGYVGTQSEPTWCEQEVDLGTNADMELLKFTIIASPNGFALLDKIILDLTPEEQPSVITLDTSNDDKRTQWKDHECLYVDSYAEYKPYGCLGNISDGNAETEGFWSPCRKDSCVLQYFNGKTTKSSLSTVRAYLTGSAEIRVTGQPTPRLSVQPDMKIEDIDVLRASQVEGQTWQDFQIDLSMYPESYVLTFELIPGDDGGVVVDWIQNNLEDVNFQSTPLPQCELVPMPTNAATITSTSTTTEDGNDKNISFMVQASTFTIVCATAFFLYLS